MSKNSSLKLSDEVNDKNSKKISNTLNVSGDSDVIDKKDTDDYRNCIINIPKLLRQLLNARVILERLPVLIISQKRIVEDSTCHSKSTDVDTDDRAKSAVNKNSIVVERYCTKCKKTDPNAAARKPKPCKRCGTSLIYQCSQCKIQYQSYTSIWQHLKTKCNSLSEEIEYKCYKCLYRTKEKSVMDSHVKNCVNKKEYKCKYCSFKTGIRRMLYRHMEQSHKGKEKNFSDTLSICNTCNRKFRRECFEEHKKTCGKNIRCKLCSYETKVLLNLKLHVKVKHQCEYDDSLLDQD